jgi:hypothetical protein
MGGTELLSASNDPIFLTRRYFPLGSRYSSLQVRLILFIRRETLAWIRFNMSVCRPQALKDPSYLQHVPR